MPNPAAFAPPDAGMSASIGPPPATAAPKAEAKPARPKDEPLDMFAPPDASDAELRVDLAPDEVERSARKRSSTPPASVPVVAQAEPPPRASRGSRPSLSPRAVGDDGQAAPMHESSNALANPNVRFVLGIAVAILLGFVPAHLVASVREKSAFASIDQHVLATQKQVDSPEAYATLDAFRSEQLARKHGERQSIAIMALLVWGAAGGAIAYVWFRRIPWDRFAPS